MANIGKNEHVLGADYVELFEAVLPARPVEILEEVILLDLNNMSAKEIMDAQAKLDKALEKICGS